MANCPEVGIIYNALWRAGAVVTPAMFLLPPEDLRHVIADAEACAVVTTPEFVDKVREAVAGLDQRPLRDLHRRGAGDGVVAAGVARAAAARARSSPAPTTTWPRCSTPAAPPAAPRA